MGIKKSKLVKNINKKIDNSEIIKIGESYLNDKNYDKWDEKILSIMLFISITDGEHREQATNQIAKYLLYLRNNDLKEEEKQDFKQLLQNWKNKCVDSN